LSSCNTKTIELKSHKQQSSASQVQSKWEREEDRGNTAKCAMKNDKEILFSTAPSVLEIPS
jgi:hypothetical protein